MNWQPVIGLEVHVQLATRSKMFSGASTAFGAAPNTQACAVDLGLPGVLPVINENAVLMAIQFGLAIGAEVNPLSVFDRKNYFYPDLPKGYQISQFSDPVVGSGQIDIELDGGTTRTVRITRAHLEEDAGKSVHDLYPGETAIDLNRAGTPLLEIVSEPDLTSAAEAAAYFRTLHALVRYLKICDGDLSQGSMRCDANVSVRPTESDPLGVRTEIKNVNSFRFLERAIDFEIERQIAVLESGGRITMETRLYDPDRDETRPMRSKEESDDYRYFPDPDLRPLRLDDALIKRARNAMPEMPSAKRARFATELALNDYDASWLTRDPDVADFFEAALAIAGNAKLTANWMMGDLAAELNRREADIDASPITPVQLGQLVQRIDDGTISSKIAKRVFELCCEQGPGASVDSVIAEEGLQQMSDTGELQRIVSELIDANPAQAEQFRNGKEKVLGFFVGQVMRATRGKANPQQVNELVRDALRNG